MKTRPRRSEQSTALLALPIPATSKISNVALRDPPTISAHRQPVQPSLKTRPVGARWRWTRDISATLASVVFHTALILVLMLLAIQNAKPPGHSLLISSGTEARQSDNAALEIVAPSQSPTDNRFDSASDLAGAQNQADISATAMAATAGIGQPSISISGTSQTGTGSVLQSLNQSSASQLFVPGASAFSGFSVDGRAPAKRAELAKANGGNAATEAAVEAAIVWLINHQYSDGSWSTSQHSHPDCRGQCSFDSIETLQPKSIAATGLALLTILGAGYTHRDGPYQKEVYAGLQFLSNAIKFGDPEPRDMRSPGQFVGASSKHMMYEQGIAAFALCEAYQMTDDPWLEPTCQSAINFVRSAQGYDGAWGYYPSTPGDLSIVGWQMMALRSATAAGLNVPATQVRRLIQFLPTQTGDGGITYGYRSRKGVPEMTAIAGLMKLMLGWSPTDTTIVKGLQSVYYRDPGLQDDGPETTDVYHNYYATNFLFYSRSNLFPQWNELLKQNYLTTQCTEGHEAGSWFRSDAEGNQFSGTSDRGLNRLGGRLYTTAMAAMTLEVYYRFLPIQNDPTQIHFDL